MLCSEISSYPDKIDPPTFFQDINIDNVQHMKEYEKLISQKKYNEANSYINKQSNFYGYFACFFNMLENRILATQTYVETLEKNNPFIYQNDEPTIASANKTIWIGKNDILQTDDNSKENTNN